MTERAQRGSRKAAAGAVAAAALATLLLAGLRFGDGPPQRPGPASLSSQPAPSRIAATATATATSPSRGAAALQRPRPPRPASAHDPVAQAAPTGLRIEGPAVRITARVCAMAYVRPLDPPGDQRHTVCWVRRGFGVAPGSDARGTTYVLGHAWAQAPLVLNPLSETVMRAALRTAPVRRDGVAIRPVTVLDGYRLILRLPSGRLTYRVYRAFAVAKEQAASVRDLMQESVPDRVVLITCGELGGVDYDDNVVVYARLASSTAANRR